MGYQVYPFWSETKKMGCPLFQKKFIRKSSTISFSVRVPVLSDSKYPIRPSSSGIVLLRTTVPGMALSCIIIHEYTTLPRSRLTRRLQGKKI